MLGISQALALLKNSINVGVSEFTDSNSAPGYGGFMRFGARDVTNTTNYNALNSILAEIYNNINSPSEKIAEGHETDSEALYELYKYFNSMAPYDGNTTYCPLADYPGNTTAYTGGNPYGTGQNGLTTGFAYTSNVQATETYTAPGSSCSKNYIIYVANNGTGLCTHTKQNDAQTYESTSAVSQLPNPSCQNWDAEWTQFLYQHGIVTYVLDVYNPAASNSNDAAYSAELQTAATQGGGKYFLVNDYKTFINDLAIIFEQIQAVNTTFASADLPVSTSNRAQNQNQVFLSLFRPDPNAAPRWYGNMKRYQLTSTNGVVDLGDVNGNSAINTTTGFLTACAVSYWTADSGGYWTNVTTNPIPKGTCPNPPNTNNLFSDSPDGPQVEKGSTAEMVRLGNSLPITLASSYSFSRTVYTLAGTTPTLQAMTGTTAPALTSNVLNFILGHDVNDENANGNTTEPRPSIHGDVIHSRPLAVNYPSSANDVVFYGSNDGTLRAVNASNGEELWAFIAPEFYNDSGARFNRLMTNSPLVAYPNMPSGVTPTPTKKDYFFDGSIGLYQNATNSQVYIYPSMRRGGRMIYGLDVSTPTSPAFLWKAGCPDLTDNTGCGITKSDGTVTAGLTNIGQTWSTPVVAFIKGYSTTTPVVIFGGGYDACEDANTSAPSCGSTTGNAIYILDASTGALVASYSTTRAVAADVSVLDIDGDGYIDYAYAADTGGNVYRMDFVDGPTTRVALSTTQWATHFHEVAHTNGAGRKFLFGPALLANSGQVYLAIGSGDREHPLQTQYPYTTPVVNRFYVYLDDLSSSTTNGNLDDTTIMYDRTTGADCSSTLVLPGGTTYKGWFITLNQNGTGEQVVTGAVIAGGMVTFSTNRPVPTPTGSCSTVLGQARGYLVNLYSGSGAIGVNGSCGGTQSGVFVQGGLPPTPVLASVPINGTVQNVLIGAIQKDGSVSTTISPQKITPPINAKRKRVYWKKSGDAN